MEDLPKWMRWVVECHCSGSDVAYWRHPLTCEVGALSERQLREVWPARRLSCDMVHRAVDLDAAHLLRPSAVCHVRVHQVMEFPFKRKVMEFMMDAIAEMPHSEWSKFQSFMDPFQVRCHDAMKWFEARGALPADFDMLQQALRYDSVDLFTHCVSDCAQQAVDHSAFDILRWMAVHRREFTTNVFRALFNTRHPLEYLLQFPVPDVLDVDFTRATFAKIKWLVEKEHWTLDDVCENVMANANKKTQLDVAEWARVPLPDTFTIQWCDIGELKRVFALNPSLFKRDIARVTFAQDDSLLFALDHGAYSTEPLIWHNNYGTFEDKPNLIARCKFVVGEDFKIPCYNVLFRCPLATQ